MARTRLINPQRLPFWSTMPMTSLGLQLRPATLDDAGLAADLDSLREPADPRDPVLMRHWWASSDATEKVVRWIAVRDGAALALVAAGHQPWDSSDARFGWTRPRLHPELWTEAGFDELIQIGEEWLRSEGTATAVFRTRDTLEREVKVAERRGYREVRRGRISELDLTARRDHIVATAAESRRAMSDQGVELVVYSEFDAPGKAEQLHRLEVETEQDIPTTVPMPRIGFEQWKARRFEDPSMRLDRLWLATEGGAPVGISQLSYPVVRGVPYTDYTATARAVRGRGIARALKYQTTAQALELGFTRVRTQNDAANAPILRINEEMGYRLVFFDLELHRDL